MALNHDQKMAFLQNMTHMALDHMSKTVNVPDQKGGMSHDKKLAFVQSMAKHGLQHFDAGGAVLSGVGMSKPTQSVVNPGGGLIDSQPATQGQESYSGSGGTNNAAVNPNTGVIGSINGALGLTNNFAAQGANLTEGTNAGQLNTAYNGVQSGLGAQQGIVNQTAGGLSQGLGAQGQLSNQLSAESMGQGPNPAQAALNQSTGQNIQQQAALMAGQRGAGANAGLIASQAAQQGAATQQQAVGQSATLQAQQQLAAQQAQASLAAQQVSQGATAVQNNSQQQQNEQNILQGANTSLNNANVAMQSNINNADSQTAAANQNAATGTLGGIMNGASSITSMFADGGTVGGDTPGFQPTSSDTSSGPSVAASAPLPSPPPSSSGGSSGGGGGGAGALSLLALLAKGGTVQSPYMAPTPLVVASSNGPQSTVGQWINTQSGTSSGPASEASVVLPASANLGQETSNMGKGGKSAAGQPMATGTAQPMAADNTMSNLGPNTMMAFKGGSVQSKLMKNGGLVKPSGKAEDAVVKGDSIKNDKIPTMLSQGEVVIDRATLADPGPLGQMARALKAHIDAKNKKGMK